MQVWAEPFTRLRLPKIFNLRTDPYEFADVTSNSYYEWFIYHAYILYGAYAIADKFAETFKDFPPIQKPNTFTIDDALGDDEECQRRRLTQTAGRRARLAAQVSVQENRRCRTICFRAGSTVQPASVLSR